MATTMLAPLAPLLLMTCAFQESTPPRLPEIGKPAPDLALNDPQGKEVRLSAFRGEKKPALLVFLPWKLAAGTEAFKLVEGLGGGQKALEKRGVQVICVAPAPPGTAKKAPDDRDGVDIGMRPPRLPYPVLSDPGGKAASLYGVPAPSGAEKAGTARAGPPAVALFLLDKEGILRYADKDHREDKTDREALGKALAALPPVAAGKEARGRAMAAPEKKAAPAITGVKFGSITVNGKSHTEDVVIEEGVVRERDKGPSKKDKDKYGHTPLTPREKIPWGCKRLIIGTGMYGSLPVTDELKEEAKKRGVELILLKTPDAVKYFLENFGSDLNAILHITC